MRSTPLLSSALAALALTTGCATDDTDADLGDADGAGGKADETHPTASTGTLTVELAPGSSAKTIQVYRKDAGFTPTYFTMTPGVAKGFSTGTYCIVTRSGSAVVSQPDCTVELQALVATTYTLGSISIVHGRDELVFGVDIDDARPDASELAGRLEPFAHPAGTFGLNIGDTYTVLNVPFTVMQGAHTDIDVTQFPGMRAVRMLPSTGRVLPDMPIAQTAPSLCANRANYARCSKLRPHDQPVLVPAAYNEATVNMGVYDASSTMRLPIATFPTTPGIVDVQMHRIDLNHVTVATTSTTSQQVVGRVTIQVLAVPGWTGDKILYGILPTGYGIDVPPGKYRVSTTYKHPVDGQTLTEVETFDFM